MSSSLTFLCDESAAQWQVFGELSRQLGADSRWQRFDSANQSSANVPSAWHLWIADRGALPWAKLGALGPAPNGMPRRLVNYFRGFEDLTMKARMARNIIAFCEQRQLDPFSHMPESFVVQPGAASDHPERQRFMQREAELKNSGCAAAWIAKSTHGAKGDNICIRSNVADIFAYVDSISDSSADEAAETTKSRFKRNKPRPAWLVQRYIARPLLIHGHKFDIRVWALLTHDYRVYLYRDGVCRLAAAPFVADSFDRDGFEFAHLTNHCIAARHADYGKLAPGNEMFFQDFQRHLAENASLWTVQEHLMPQISDIVGLAFRSVREVRFFLFFLFLNSFKLALRLTVSNISLLLWSYS
jgi:tubulin--tyrosine ligase